METRCAVSGCHLSSRDGRCTGGRHHTPRIWFELDRQRYQQTLEAPAGIELSNITMAMANHR